MKFDKWQQDIIDHKGSITLRSGRQVGKSTTIGRRCAKLMIKFKNSNSLIIAPAQRQSSQLFIKVMSWLQEAHQKALNKDGGYKTNEKLSERRKAR